MKKAIYTSPSINVIAISSASVISASGLANSVSTDNEQNVTALNTKGMLGFTK